MLFLCFWSIGLLAHGEPKQIRVFIALCDNQSQGIIPVSPQIGNGDNPDANLYWGCDEGFGPVFRHSKNWQVLESQSDVSQTVLRRVKLSHVQAELALIADAYRGSEIRSAAAYARNQGISTRSALRIFSSPVP